MAGWFALFMALLVSQCYGLPCGLTGNNAVIRMENGNCSLSTRGVDLDFAFCGTAFQVAANSSTGAMTLTPVSETVTYYSCGERCGHDYMCPYVTYSAKVTDPATATVAIGGATKSVLEAVPSVNLLALSIRYVGASLTCSFKYRVTRGCLLGITPSTRPRVPCPPGTANMTGAQSQDYCEPCLPGTYSSTDYPACLPCPTESRRGVLPKALLRQCPSCLPTRSCTNKCLYGGSNRYPGPDGKCKDCPPGSSLTPEADSCAQCVDGRRCCVVNPYPGCPACPAGTKGRGFNFTVAAVAVSGSAREACQSSGLYQCYQKMGVAVLPDCRLQLDMEPAYRGAYFLTTLSAAPLPARPDSPPEDAVLACDTVTSVGMRPPYASIGNAGVFDLGKDVLAKLLIRDMVKTRGKLVHPSGATFQAVYPATTCRTTYRLLQATNLKALAPLTSTTCPAAARECRKPCPAGSYLHAATVCLLCPPGTYTNKANSASCTKCKKGTAAFGSGNTRCKVCEAGSYAAAAGSAVCAGCIQYFNTGWSKRGATACTLCPAGTISVATGCISTYAPSPCCASGVCAPLPKCKGAPPKMSAVPALLRLSTKSASCKGYPLVGCMPVGGYMYGLQGFPPAAPDYIRSAKLALLGGSKAGSTCGDALYGREVRYWQTGLNTIAFEAYVHLTGQATASPGRNTLSITMYKEVAATALLPASPSPSAACTATLELVSGVMAGMKRSAASCPKGLLLTSYGSFKACKSCGRGSILSAAGKCVPCRGTTFSLEYDSTACTACPPGKRASVNVGQAGAYQCA